MNPESLLFQPVGAGRNPRYLESHGVSPDIERHGIEDLRLVTFRDGDGSRRYYGTFTAYKGVRILSPWLEYRDGDTIGVRLITGKPAQNKGMALFPRPAPPRPAIPPGPIPVRRPASIRVDLYRSVFREADSPTREAARPGTTRSCPLDRGRLSLSTGDIGGHCRER